MSVLLCQLPAAESNVEKLTRRIRIRGARMKMLLDALLSATRRTLVRMEMEMLVLKVDMWAALWMIM